MGLFTRTPVNAVEGLERALNTLLKDLPKHWSSKLRAKSIAKHLEQLSSEILVQVEELHKSGEDDPALTVQIHQIVKECKEHLRILQKDHSSKKKKEEEERFASELLTQLSRVLEMQGKKARLINDEAKLSPYLNCAVKLLNVSRKEQGQKVLRDQVEKHVQYLLDWRRSHEDNNAVVKQYNKEFHQARMNEEFYDVRKKIVQDQRYGRIVRLNEKYLDICAGTKRKKRKKIRSYFFRPKQAFTLKPTLQSEKALFNTVIQFTKLLPEYVDLLQRTLVIEKDEYFVLRLHTRLGFLLQRVNTFELIYGDKANSDLIRQITANFFRKKGLHLTQERRGSALFDLGHSENKWISHSHIVARAIGRDFVDNIVTSHVYERMTSQELAVWLHEEIELSKTWDEGELHRRYLLKK